MQVRPLRKLQVCTCTCARFKSPAPPPCTSPNKSLLLPKPTHVSTVDIIIMFIVKLFNPNMPYCCLVLVLLLSPFQLYTMAGADATTTFGGKSLHAQTTLTQLVRVVPSDQKNIQHLVDDYVKASNSQSPAPYERPTTANPIFATTSSNNLRGSSATKNDTVVPWTTVFPTLNLTMMSSAFNVARSSLSWTELFSKLHKLTGKERAEIAKLWETKNGKFGSAAFWAKQMASLESFLSQNIAVTPDLMASFQAWSSNVLASYTAALGLPAFPSQEAQFRAALVGIRAVLVLSQGSSASFSLNFLSILDPSEVRRMMGGRKPDPKQVQQHSLDASNLTTMSINMSHGARELTGYPSSFFLGDYGRLNPIQNQGWNCGDCWAFAATAALEGAIASYQHLPLPKLAEEQLTDCSNNGGDNGCDGGFVTSAWSYLDGGSGQCLENNYPFSLIVANQAGACQTTCSGYARPAQYTYLPSTEWIMYAVMTWGPVAVSFEGGDSNCWQGNTGQLITAEDPNCNCAGWHAVNIVGWDTAYDGTPYWIVRNQWTTSWGDQGYGFVERNTNWCSFESNAYAVTQVQVTNCATPSNTNFGSEAWSTTVLYPGMYVSNGNYFTIMQCDGNLVTYTYEGKVVWASGTNGRGGSVAVMQGDGNLVIYGNYGVSNQYVVWASNTCCGVVDPVLYQSPDGALQIWQYSGGVFKYIWGST